MPLTGKERTALIQKVEKAIKEAKNKAQLREAFTDKEYGYLVLGYKVLGRLLIGKTVEEAGARRGDKS